VIERLHEPRVWQVPLHDLAAGRRWVVEVVTHTVGLPPVVHRVDDELAAELLHRDGGVLAERQGEDHYITCASSLGWPRGAGAGGEHLGRQRNGRRIA